MAARALLGWSQHDLCKAAGISRSTLIDIERETGDPRRSSIAAVKSALTAAGIVLIVTDDQGSGGVKLARK